MNNSIYYHPPVFRPPSESNSLLIQATIGCTYSCPFCAANIGKKFGIREIGQIKQDLDTAGELYGGDVRRIFFLDGNCMIMPADQLLEITAYAYQVFPQLDRVSVYTHAQD
ncbi:MAG: radical SAM protein, partial [Planctomycetes bacterium]|nr:radical SAM protein [Planctomycetota bacterium]